MGADEIEEYSSSAGSSDEQGPDEAHEHISQRTESSSPSPARAYESGYDDVPWIGMAGLDEFDADMLAGAPSAGPHPGQMTSQNARLPVQELLSAPLNDFTVPSTAADGAELPLSPTAGVAVYGADARACARGGGAGVHPAEVRLNLVLVDMEKFSFMMR